MRQYLLQLLTKPQQSDISRKEGIQAQVDEYRDLLDGMDVLIQQLQRRNAIVTEERGRFEEWPETYELLC